MKATGTPNRTAYSLVVTSSQPLDIPQAGDAAGYVLDAQVGCHCQAGEAEDSDGPS